MRRGVRRLLLGTAGGLAGVAAAAGATAFLLHRARGAPDPLRGERLDERPGTEHRVVSFDGTELAVNVTGPSSGPTLVFAHGFSLDMTAWHFQWKAFRERHRCVLYDHRGHGLSGPAAGGDYSLDALGRDLRAVLDEVVPDGPAIVLGHSLGGMALMSLAALHPEEFGNRVRGVVLVNTTAGDVLRSALGAAGARLGTALLPGAQRVAGNPDRLYRVRSAAIGRGSGLAFLAARVTNFGSDVSPSVVEHVVRTAARAPAEVWTDLFAGLLELDLRHALEHIAVPALVLAGDVDRLTPPASSVALKRALPDARMVLFRGAGHCTMLERPDQFNEVVEGFVEEVLSGSLAAEPAGAAR